MPICAAVNVKAVGQETADDADNMEIINPAYPEQKIKVGRNISADTRKQIIQLLVQCMDVFAWSENDMTGVPRHIVEYGLNVNPALKPIVQKRRGMALDRMKWLCEEVAKLVRAGILREVQNQSWIANPVLVKKPDENMIAPKTIKEVQNLTGKLAALTRFLSKAAERQFLFFKTLKGCLKQKSFVWSSEAETAFQDMKKLLKTLPTLTVPINGEILYLYISVANEAFGSVLIVERNKIQKPVYFVSKALTGSEVMADYLAEMSGELEVINERTTLKPVLDETWDLFTDGASCAEGADAGLVLANPSGEERTYPLRFNFDVSNNEAEYEALLAGLNIARKMNIAKLQAFTDSQLVANQFNGSFEAHDPSMQKYLQLLKELAARFEHFELAQVPRSQNKKADALSKLAALTFSHFQKQPNWMEPIIQYIRNDALPSDSHEARLVRERAPMYIIQNDILYRKSYCGPMMRCVGPIEAEMIVEEVHNGTCALHSGYKTIAAKIMRMGPIPTGPDNVKFLIVAIDYFTKWVEAKAVRTITVTLSIGISTKLACAVAAASRASISEQMRSPMAGGSGSGMVQCGAISSRNSTLSRSHKAAA
ncbi:uncharacterized protein [Rutidosis leptorrhynchoides]|uniref:uncharacterized protein n=1 Tax=Rutidosis leptorrhynchoides TaxID=125765 RepID=UPI003A991A77